MQNAIDKLNTMLSYLEKKPDKTKEDFDKIKDKYETLNALFKFKSKDVKSIITRYNTLVSENDIDDITPIKTNSVLSLVSPRSFKVKRVAITAATLGTVVGVLGCTLTSCNNAKKEVVTPEVIEYQQPEPTIKPIEFTEMSNEIKIYSDDIADAINDSITKGFEITESNKQVMSKKFINYINIINMENLSAAEWKDIYQDGNITSQDMMNDLWDIETVFEKIVTVAENEDEMLNFNLYFNAADADLLNKAGSMIIKINTSKGSERTNAIKEMHDFIIDTLTITENRMQYSEVALNTFRGVFVNAFDVLSNGKSITDEEEHAIFTVTTNCLKIQDSNLDVQDKTIKSLQSKYELYMLDKIDFMNNKEVDTEINKYNSINEMSIYIANKLDLSKYKPAKDYVEFQEKLFLGKTNTTGTVTKKAKNDSGVSDGKGGVISSAQFAKYNINPSDPQAKVKLEAEVKKEFEATHPAVEKDITGQFVVDPATADSYVRQGADDFNMNRGYNINNVPEAYKSSYKLGWDTAKEAAASYNNKVTETYEKVENGSSTIIDSTVTEQDYVGNITPTPDPVVDQEVVVPEPTPDVIEKTETEEIFDYTEDPYENKTYEENGYIITEEFVPAEETTITETYEEIGFTTSSIRSQINNLNSLKAELLSAANIYTEEVSKQKC